MHDEAYARIPLRNKRGEITAWTLVDADRKDWANQWRWFRKADGYVARNSSRAEGMRAMHRELLGLVKDDGIWVDHWNRNRLDNRLRNLRLADPFMNAQNASPRPHSSRYRGVSWWASEERWIVRIRTRGKKHYLGAFTSEDEAGAVAAAFYRAHTAANVNWD